MFCIIDAQLYGTSIPVASQLNNSYQIKKFKALIFNQNVSNRVQSNEL